MQLIVGDESLQFRFVNNKTTPSTVPHEVLYDSEMAVLTADAGIIQHMTLGITKISPSHSVDEYSFWDMAEYVSPPLDPEKSYYLYAKCSASTESGSFLLSESAIKMDDVAGYHHFLMGIVNSEYQGERSVVMLYGFTEILPGRITTDKIASTDGKTYFDLANGKIVGNIRFLNENNEEQDIETIRLLIQYSSNGTSWHDVYLPADKYMRVKNGIYGEWSDKMPFQGPDGVGIASVTEYYQVSSSNTEAPTTWITTIPQLTKTNKYLWNYEKITYTSGTPTYTIKK